jgi:hypothetical protein
MELPESSEKESCKHALSETQRELAACKGIMQDLLNRRLSFWEEAVGSDAVLDMLRDRKIAEKYLQHQQSDFRFIALNIIRDHWKPDEQFIAICEKLVDSDDDARVRAAAVTSLGVCCDSTGDRRIGQVLARMVADAAQPEALRKSAYHALMQLDRGGVYLEASVPMSDSPMQFPDDVDWALVSSYLPNSLSV